MKFSDISLPEVYLESYDFRFFLRWFTLALTKIQYDTENLSDIYDPLRCPEDLLWMLSDTMGYKYDDRLPIAFNRLVLVYFMSMIRNRGSKDGVTLAAEINLAQFNILNYGKEKDILYNRLEDTSIPVNAAYVTPHTAEGYIEVVYFSSETPVDACIEYVRPLGMYLFQHAGVRFDARTKISIDARLTNMGDLSLSMTPTHVGHYTRRDYASLQHMTSENDPTSVSGGQRRANVYYRNKDYEGTGNSAINPGYRALCSLQLSNNDHIVKSLIPNNPDNPLDGSRDQDQIFGLGYTPTDVSVYTGPDVLKDEDDEPKSYNLRYDLQREKDESLDVFTIDESRSSGVTKPRPAVNPIMSVMGEAISFNDENTVYSMSNDDGYLELKDSDEI